MGQCSTIYSVQCCQLNVACVCFFVQFSKLHHKHIDTANDSFFSYQLTYCMLFALIVRG